MPRLLDCVVHMAIEDFMFDRAKYMAGRRDEDPKRLSGSAFNRRQPPHCKQLTRQRLARLYDLPESPI